MKMSVDLVHAVVRAWSNTGWRSHCLSAGQGIRKAVPVVDANTRALRRRLWIGSGKCRARVVYRVSMCG